MINFPVMGRRAVLAQLTAGAALSLPAASGIAQTLAYSPSTEPLQLGVLAAQKGILFGSTFQPYLFNLPDGNAQNWPTSPYVEMIAHQCSLATILYQWSGVEPTQGNFAFNRDAHTNFWSAQGLRIRVQALAWAQALPPWFAALPSRTAAIDALTNHVSTLVNHLKGKVWSYDVVNEGINPPDGLAYGLRKSPFTTLIGTDWMEYAFKAARAADPAALLTYNDYHSECTGYADFDARRTSILALIDRFQKNGVPIDAIGLQSHLWNQDYWQFFNAKSFSTYLSQISSRGVKIFLSELDTMDLNLPTNTAQRDRAVATIYKTYLDTALVNPAVQMVTAWGLTDPESYQVTAGQQFARPDGTKPRALLFDSSFRPKDAATAVAASFSAAAAR